MTRRINVTDFNLAATLECGQAFRWQRGPDGWFTGIVGGETWRLRQEGEVLLFDVGAASPPRIPGPVAAGTPLPQTLQRVQRYLSLNWSLPKIVATFPDDGVLHDAVRRHWGLRVLRQEPWETLASFIASSTKQIVQIRQIVELLAQRFGEPIAAGRARSPSAPLSGDTVAVSEKPPYHSFPNVEVIARATHEQLLECKLGFRARYLMAAARAIDRGEVQLEKLPAMEYDRALEELTKLPGVGEKIAACTLLFSCGHNEAFPIDVWVERSLRRLYFSGSKVTARRLREFTRSHFGPYAGWAQQYLFFQERTREKSPG